MAAAMEWVFWLSAALVFFCYAGYPAVLWLWGRWRARPVNKAEFLPFISIVLPVHNGRRFLEAKLENLLALDYPAERFEIIVVFDGSSDGSPGVAARFRDRRLLWHFLDRHRGKAAALNAGVSQAQGEILVFTDVRQILTFRSLRHLAANFSDPRVGAVTGELCLASACASGETQALGLYYRYEQWMRRQESAIHSTLGATGSLFAVRGELFHPLPADLILDDVFTPMQAVLGGYRCVFEPEARAFDPRDQRSEFRRRLRTLVGNYQLLALCPALLSWRNPVWFQFVCHKLTRLAVPFALLGALVSSAALSAPFYRVAFVLQVGFYVFALSARRWPGLARLARLSELGYAFLVANCAAFLSLFFFLRGKRDVWV